MKQDEIRAAALDAAARIHAGALSSGKLSEITTDEVIGFADIFEAYIAEGK